MMELGSVYYQNGKLDESEAQYRKALLGLNKSEERTLTEYNLSRVLYDKEILEEARKYAWLAYDERDFVLNDIQQANIIYNYALIQEDFGKTDEAVRLYNEALVHNPNHVKSKVNLSAIYMAQEEPDADKALELLLEAYKTDKNDFSVNNNLGTAYFLKDDNQKAVDFYKRALSIEPLDTSAMLNLANVYTKDSIVDDAADLYNKVIVLEPENLEAYVGLAKIQIQKGEAQGAYRNLLYVRGKNPSFRKAEVDSLIAVLEN